MLRELRRLTMLGRLLVAGSVAVMSWTATSGVSGGLPVAASSCNSGYSYAGWYSYNFANQGIYGDIDENGLHVASPTTEHMLAYLDGNNQSDTHAYWGQDWLQAGFGVGLVDAVHTSSTEVYEESSDLTTGAGAVAHYYSLPLGDQLFQVWNTGQSGYGGTRQLWYAYDYASNGTAYFLGDSWQLTPKSDEMFAQIEAYMTNQTCAQGEALFGQFENLQIENSTGAMSRWTPSFIPATAEQLDPPYRVTTYYKYYNFGSFAP